MIDCPYKEKCIDYKSEKCKTCKHNENRSYYELAREEPAYNCYYPYPYPWDSQTTWEAVGNIR